MVPGTFFCPYTRGGDERQGQVGTVLIPTDILRPLGLVHLIPIFLTIHLVSSTPLRVGHFTSNQWFLEPFSVSVSKALLIFAAFSSAFARSAGLW